jgi:hypothetical protein
MSLPAAFRFSPVDACHVNCVYSGRLNPKQGNILQRRINDVSKKTPGTATICRRPPVVQKPPGIDDTLKYSKQETKALGGQHSARSGDAIMTYGDEIIRTNHYLTKPYPAGI